MSQTFTIKTLLESKCGKLNLSLAELPKKKDRVIKPRNDCKEVQKMHWDLKYFCIERKIAFEHEFQFARKDRIPTGMKSKKYRFDFCLPQYKIGIEYHGLNSEKSGHTTLTGFTKDTEKSNLAQELGYEILTFTVLNYKNVLQEVIKILNKKNGK